MNFIKKIFENQIDSSIHKQFVRYGKGTFQDRALVELNISKNIKIKTSFEYANELVRFLANTIKDKVHVTGGIITTKAINDFNFENIKQFAGVKTYQIDADLSRNEILNLMDKHDALYCLSFSTEYGSLKIKVKTPKSAKPGKEEGDEAKADYCTFTSNDLNLRKEFAFDVKGDFKKFKASHTFIINELIVPKEFENDFARARFEAKRKGKIIRITDVDGKKNEITKDVIV